jgi:hypothetical protein
MDPHLEVNGQFHASAALHPVDRRLLSFRASLDDVEN